MKKALLILLLMQSFILPQSLRIMTYNLLNYPGTDTTGRNPYFRTTLSYVNPDILVVQEVTSQAGVNGFLNNVLNSFGFYKAGTFIDGYDTDNAIFFRDSAFTFLSNTRITTALRDINQFSLIVNASGDTLHIFSVHLKASQGTEEEAARAAEVDKLRAVTNNLHSGANYFVVGDFNLYTSAESAYQKLLNQSASGYFLDPINKPGVWHNNSAFASIHTQSPRVEQFGGGSTGGMDDRFDFILISQAAKDEGGIVYKSGSYTVVGNDGAHFNKSINVQPNTAVPTDVANALYYGADHLPVYAEFTYDKPQIAYDSLPLQIGNLWSYKETNPGLPDRFTNMEIISDTTLSDSLTYYLFNGYSGMPHLLSSMVRCDSGMVYFYNSLDSSDVPVFKFTANPGDEWETKWVGGYNNVSLNSIDTLELFSKTIRIFNFNLGGIVFANVNLSPELGFIKVEDYGDQPSAISNRTFELTGCIINDTTYGIISSVAENSVVPSVYNLSQNYPNPFNSTTTIEYYIPEGNFVSITLYDILGQTVKVLEQKYQNPGRYTINLNTDGLSTGIYYYRMVTDNFTETKKLVYLK